MYISKITIPVKTWVILMTMFRLKTIVIILLLPFLVCAQNPPTQLLTQAMAAHKAGKLDQAIKLYKQVLQSDSKSFIATYNLGLILLQKRKPADALPYLTKASNLRPTSSEPIMAKANALLDLGKTSDGLTTLINAEKICAKIPEYWMMRAGLEAQTGKTSQAKTSIVKARQLAPKRGDVAYRAGAVFATFGEPEKALLHFQDAIAIQPKNVDFILGYVQVLRSTNRLNQAIEVMKSATNSNPKELRLSMSYLALLSETNRLSDALIFIQNKLTNTKLDSPFLAAKAEILMRENKTQEALSSANEAVAKDASNAQARLTRASILASIGKFVEARNDATAVIKSDPSQTRAYNIKQRCEQELNLVVEREFTLRAWIASEKMYPTPYRLLGQLLFDKKSYLQSVAAFESYFLFKPNDPDSYDTAAQAYMLAGNAPGAADLIQRASANGVKTADLFVRLVLAFRQMGDSTNALTALRKMRVAFPQDIRSWTLEGATYEKMSQWQKALDIYKDLMIKRPTDSSGYDGVARMQLQLGDRISAAKTLEAMGDNVPGTSQAYLAAAREYSTANQPQLAEQMWARVTATKPNDEYVWAGLASYRADRGQIDAAVDAYRKLWTINPNNSLARRAAAEILYQNKRQGDAFDLLAQDIDRFVSDGSYMGDMLRAAKNGERLTVFKTLLEGLFDRKVLPASATINYVDASISMGLLDACIGKLKILGALNPNAPGVFVALSRAQAIAGDVAGALESIEKASDISPKDEAVLRTFAGAAESARNSSKTAKAYKMLWDALQNDPNLALKAAGYLLETGDKVSAKQVLVAANAKFPQNKDVATMLAKIN